jgi:hypothetical protein
MSISSVQQSVRQHETALVPCLTKSVGVVGSRSLPYSLADKVGLITEDLIKRKYHIATGGAIDADQFVIERLLRLGLSDHCTVYSPWQNYPGFRVKVRPKCASLRGVTGVLHMLVENTTSSIARNRVLLYNFKFFLQ